MKHQLYEIYISGRGICDALGISRQKLQYYVKKYARTQIGR